MEQARTVLEQWVKANAATRRTLANDARASFLTARLAVEAQQAEDSYLKVALSHATSRYAAESLLRLGQARLAAHDARQAIVYLQRLLADYPSSDQRAAGALWLARAQKASKRTQAACTTVRNALQLRGADPETAALLREEERLACAEQSATVAAAGAPATSARFAIQVGAFRERSGARAIARQLEQAGFADVRLALVPDNSLLRVRVGTFESAAVAQPTVARLKAAGFSAVIVADRLREKPLTD